MNIVFQGYLEMVKAWYNSGKERTEGKTQMEKKAGLFMTNH